MDIVTKGLVFVLRCHDELQYSYPGSTFYDILEVQKMRLTRALETRERVAHQGSRGNASQVIFFALS